MSDFLEDAERAALRDVAHLLPAKWQQMIDVVAASLRRPRTPSPPQLIRLRRDSSRSSTSWS
jgi:hypothetical protein